MYGARMIELMDSDGATETGRITPYIHVSCLTIYEQSKKGAKDYPRGYNYSLSI